jgi:predicted P-loop ATPase
VLLHGMNTMHVSEFLNALADAHPYNPVASWICSKPWDGKDRLPEICATLKVEDGYPDDLKNLLVEKWLLSAVAAVFSTEEFSARGVLTLQGPQSLGKTSWIRSLANDPKLAADLILTGHHLDPGNKDSVMSAIAHWIVEIGELDSSFKKDVAMLKGFLSNPSDRFRRPYGKLDNVYRRRTVFAATVNDYNFLIDATGNTRFWTLPVVKINYNHKIEMQQVFAQLKIRFEEDHQWWLTNAEEALLESMNKQHRSISSMRELLEDAIDHDLIGTDGLPAYSATTLLVKLGMDRPTNPQARECAASLRELIGESKRINGSTTWRVPLKDEGKFPGL